VYVGEGGIKDRIGAAYDSERRGQSWDHFSWYALKEASLSVKKLSVEFEALLLRMLPPHLRMLNRKRGKVAGSRKMPQKNKIAEYIDRPNLYRSHS